MKIALVGYGKMGKAIESIALEKGHDIVLKIDLENTNICTVENLRLADVAIEFTGAASAVKNIKTCIEACVPIVCGSTGWLSEWDVVSDYCKAKNGALLYASNFSIGVNIFFAVNKYLTNLMGQHSNYKPSIHEVHHTQKKDAPSGTAISLADQIISNQRIWTGWAHDTIAAPQDIMITSERTDPAPGTHTVSWHSEIDSIEIKHEAHSRTGFAMGAVLAAEFLHNKKGIFSMNDVLGY